MGVPKAKVAGGLPNCEAFSGGRPGKYLGDYENAVYKHTYEESKGKSFDLYLDHLKTEHYDRKIWMARDPRDVAVSRMLYRWQRGNKGQKEQYQAHLDLVLKKENDPASVSFSEIYRYARFNDWPLALDSVYAEEQVRYQRMHDFVKHLGEDWFFLTYDTIWTQTHAAYRFDRARADRYEPLVKVIPNAVDVHKFKPASPEEKHNLRKNGTSPIKNLSYSY